MVAHFGDLDVHPHWLPFVAAAQLAGAIGLLLGLRVDPIVGLAAAIGLVVFFIGAIAVHIGSGAYKSIPGPALFLALAIATVVFAVLR
jgi:DoxX-like family